MTRDELAELSMVFEELPGFASIIEVPGYRVTRINRKLRESTEGPRMLGKSVRDFYRSDSPVFEVLDRVAATGQAEIVRARPPDLANRAYAERYYTRSYTPLRDEHGTVHGILSVGFDVTEEVLADRAHAEADRERQLEIKRLFALLEEAPVFLLVAEGPELRVTTMNRRSRDLFKRLVIGVPLRTFIPPDNKSLASIERVYATGVPESFEAVASMEQFHGRSFLQTVVPLRDSDGSVTRVMVVSVETTEQRQASEAKDRLLAIIGHELRNPLARWS